MDEAFVLNLTAKQLTASLQHFEKALGWPTDILVCLSEETDWSFVIRACAMIEASLSTMLSRHEPRLETAFHELPMGHQKYGKVTVARSLGLISDEQKRFVEWLTKMRNRCAHDVTALNFSLVGYIESLSLAEQASFYSSLEWGLPTAATDGTRNALRANPKLGVLSGLLRFLTHAAMFHEIEALRTGPEVNEEMFRRLTELMRSVLNSAIHQLAVSRFPPQTS